MKPKSKSALPLVSPIEHEDWRRRTSRRAEKLTYLTFFLAGSEFVWAVGAHDTPSLIVSFLIVFVSGFAVLDF
jgi:hypothetical protein